MVWHVRGRGCDGVLTRWLAASTTCGDLVRLSLLSGQFFVRFLPVFGSAFI